MNDTFLNRFKEVIALRGISQAELCQRTGIPKSAMSQYLSGSFKPKQQRTYLLAKALNVNPAWLMGYDVSMEEDATQPQPKAKNLVRLDSVKYIPLLGRIACGDPILAEENIVDRILLPSNVNATFALTCEGDSMTGAGIEDGDVVFIREQPQVENGEIAAVLIGDTATLKKVYLSDNKLTLMPMNPAHDPFFFVGEEMQDIRIIGKAVAVLKDLE